MIWLDVIKFFSRGSGQLYPHLVKLIEESTRDERRGTKDEGRRTKDEGRWTKDEGRGTKDERRGTKDENHGIRNPVSGIQHQIDLILDGRGGIRDTASPALQKVRKKMTILKNGMEKKMHLILAQARQRGWTDEDADVTVRDGRWVIPIRSTHKRKLPGYIWDESATGQTVYLEPGELFEMNREIQELHYEERREIIRILTGIADEIRPFIPAMINAIRLLGQLDFIRAKASFAIDIGASMCRRVGKNPLLHWEQAVHPLLLLAHRKTGKPVVPLTIQLTSDQRVLVISGPNAGGKSICLKTVGLLQYMLQCGILPPAREDSEFGIFRHILIDIGDEQSVENDLSTYSSKLLNMKFFLSNLDKLSLFLIDEMGSGTDPSVGGAIAEAALERMAFTGAFGVVTTHYSNLKLLAGKIDGVVNGAMLYDSHNMKPLYHLRIGKPGGSFALEIATIIGFPEDILKHASEKIGGSQLDFDRQIQDLEFEKEEVRKRSTEVHVADAFLHELITKYQKLADDLKKSKQEILDRAREEAGNLLDDSNKLIERTIREIKESQAEKERTKRARAEVKQMKDKVHSPQSPVTAKSPKGDFHESETNIQHPLTTNHLPVTSHQSPVIGPQSVSGINGEKMGQISLTLDIRGMRADEAFMAIQRYVDDAILLSAHEIRILHGKGNGVLREVTRNYLRSVKEVKRYHDEHMEHGGAGITVIHLK